MLAKLTTSSCELARAMRTGYCISSLATPPTTKAIPSRRRQFARNAPISEVCARSPSCRSSDTVANTSSENVPKTVRNTPASTSCRALRKVINMSLEDNCIKIEIGSRERVVTKNSAVLLGALKWSIRPTTKQSTAKNAER